MTLYTGKISKNQTEMFGLQINFLSCTYEFLFKIVSYFSVDSLQNDNDKVYLRQYAKILNKSVVLNWSISFSLTETCRLSDTTDSSVFWLQ